MMTRTSAVLLSLLALAPGALGQVTSCDMCMFTGSDSSNCKVYGQLGDGKLIAWDLASQACLNAFNIKAQAVDSATLKGMFPNADGTGGNIANFVNYLRFNDGSVEQGIKASLPDIWVEDTTLSPPKVVLKESITVSGTAYNCKTSASSCWTALKTYFGTTAGAASMVSIGKTLYNNQAKDLELQQSLARIRLCSDGATTACGTLSDKVQTVKAANPSAKCSAFGLGPASIKIPGCDGTSSSSTTGGKTSAAGAARPGGLLAVLGAAALAVAAVL